MAYANLFKNSAQASAYALYRPTYPGPLFQAILHYAGLGRGYKGKLAVDVATGSGQALQGLEGYFEALIGIDASLDQINNAVQLPNLTYCQGDAHTLPLEDQSADLVTVAQALHWFDRPKFYKEAGRVLKDDGVLAVWTYDAGHVVPDDGPINKVYLDMCNTVLGPYWAGPRIIVDNCYRDIEPLAPDYFMESKRLEFPLSTTLSVDDLVGYVQSWSAYATAKKDHPELPDPIIAFRERLEKAHAEQGSPPVVAINRIMTLIMGKRPVRK